MPRPRKHERIECRYYTWLLSCRDGVWRADGRSNRPNIGRHSLGTKDRNEAVKLLARLDLTMAVRHGRADPAAIRADAGGELALAEGRRRYEAHVARAVLVGGARPATRKRYRAVFDKFVRYTSDRGVTTWNRVTARVLEGYLAHLEADGYAYRTQYLEATTLKQAVAWLIGEGHLPPECRIVLHLRKAVGTDTYCWRAEEVVAILAYCRGTPGLGWLADVLTALTFTGLRISELIALRWSDLDFAADMIRLVDETGSGRPTGGRAARTLKGGRGRALPLHDELRPVLAAIPRHRDGYVFHGPEGGRLKADTVRRTLIRDVLTPLGERFPTPPGEVGFTSGRLHSFRHLFCSLSASRGVPQQTVMTWLGHRDSKMVAHYFTLYDDEARRQMARVVLPDDAGGA